MTSSKPMQKLSYTDEEEEEDDVVVLRVCAGCRGIDDLVFDVDAGLSYCRLCRELAERTRREGFRVLLGEDDRALVGLIFSHFDAAGKGFWDYQDWAAFQKATGRAAEELVDSPAALAAFFKEEYDLELGPTADNKAVVRLVDLENMYGGYAYNQIDALIEDSETLESEGIIQTGVLE